MKYTFKGFCKEYFRRMNLWGNKTKTHYSEQLLKEEAVEQQKTKSNICNYRKFLLTIRDIKRKSLKSLGVILCLQ